MTPAERLRAAATRLREVAETATPGPWEVALLATGGGEELLGVYPVGDRSFFVSAGGGPDEDNDAALIAMMHPGVALALADWLTKESTFSEDFTPREALAVADAVLGGEES